MNPSLIASFILLFTLGLVQTPALAQPTPATPNPATQPLVTPGAPPSEAEMMKKMIALAQPGENQKLLAGMAGTWTYVVTMWMSPDPKAAPQISKGTAVRKMIMGGRYLVGDYTTKMQMPGADGKMKDVEFKGMGVDAYDNVKEKFVSSWLDNMGTGIALLEGDYDAAAKAFTYTGELEMMPGMKTKVRQVIKMVDNDHGIMDWYEDRGGQEMRTMEIVYTRQK